jgi:cyclic-di-AMP phosphodiesterase PgpH
MEKSEKEIKKKGPRISRLGESKKASFKENAKIFGRYLLSLPKEKFLLLLLLCLFIALVNAPNLFISSNTYQAGERAPFDIKAPRSLLMEDMAATGFRRQEVAASVLSIYDFNEKIGQDLQKKIRLGFLAMREEFKKKPADLKEKKQEGHPQLEKMWGIELTRGEFNTLFKNRFSEAIENGLIRLIQSVMAIGVVNNKMALLNEQEKGIEIRKLPSKQEFQIHQIERLPDQDEARDLLEKRSVFILVGKLRPISPLIVGLAQKLIVPNLFYNKAETDDRINKAIQGIRPVYYQIKKGDIIVREGEKITETDLEKIRMSFQPKEGANTPLGSLGLALIWGLFMYMIYLTATREEPVISGTIRDLVFLASLLAVSFLIIRTFDYLAQIVVGGFPGVNPQSVLLIMPIAAAPMMISLVLGLMPAMMFALVQAFLTAIFWAGNPELAVYFAVAGLWASLSRRGCHNRWDLIRMGFSLGLVNIAGILALQLIHGKWFHLETPINFFSGFLGGIIAGIIVTGFSPLIERIFGYTTDMKLLERASMDQPLLRDLMVQAPGTYHHSIIVGNMVEAAAEAIGANALLARVSAYYHDIGKIQKPLYFIENQMDVENKHEKLAPSMSSLILMAHVKDGVEMARLNKLEAPIIEIISQHHGTGLITFFYNKALESKGGDMSQVSMEDFRYPGPKPQTREAGLVLLADSIEAASRTLVDPTPSRIQGLVQKIIQNAFSDGQLDECALTLKDLSLISLSYIKILNAIFHHRIEYPESFPKIGMVRKKGNGDIDKQSAETDRSAKDAEDLSKDIRLLGTP